MRRLWPSPRGPAGVAAVRAALAVGFGPPRASPPGRQGPGQSSPPLSAPESLRAGGPEMTPADIFAELEQLDRRRVTRLEELKAALDDAVAAPVAWPDQH